MLNEHDANFMAAMGISVDPAEITEAPPKIRASHLSRRSLIRQNLALIDLATELAEELEVREAQLKAARVAATQNLERALAAEQKSGGEQ